MRKTPPAVATLSAIRIDKYVHDLRGHNVMLDADLAELYGVEVKVLNQTVKRNAERFPADFMFQLTADETTRLRSQIVTSKPGRGGRRYLPFAFTEEGVAMLSSVLRSERAVRVNIEIMRAFVRMRRLVVDHKDLSERFDALEVRYDGQFKVVFQAIRRLMAPRRRRRKTIGFRPEGGSGSRS
jgi:ORF6N domain